LPDKVFVACGPPRLRPIVDCRDRTVESSSLETLLAMFYFRFSEVVTSHDEFDLVLLLLVTQPSKVDKRGCVKMFLNENS